MSQAPAYDLKTYEIIKSLNEMKRSEKVNEVLLRRYKQEAEKLKNTDLAQAFSIKGMIACLEKNIPEMHSCHKSALLYSNRETSCLQHYASSLANAGLFDEAYTYGIEVHERDLSAPEPIDQLIRICYNLGNSEEIFKYLDKYRALTGKNHPILDPLPEDDMKYLSECIVLCDEILEKRPELIEKPDMELLNLADELVKGVVL